MSIARRSVLPIANVAIGAVLGLLALKAITVYMSKDAYGEVEGVIAVLGIIYLFADLSMSEAHIKRVSEGVSVGDCFATFAVFRIASSIAFVLASAGALYVYTVVLGRTLEDISTWAILFAMVYYLGKSAMSIGQSTFDAQLEQARSQLVSFVETLVRVVLTVTVAFAFAALVNQAGPLAGRIGGDAPALRFIAEHPAGALAAAWAVAALVATIVSFYYLLRARVRGRFRWDILRSYFAFAIPLFLPQAATIIAVFIDRTVLALFGTNVDTADFSAPRRIVTVLEGVSMAVGLLLFPALSAMLARGERAAAERTVDKSLRYLSILMMPIAAFLIVFPEPIILIGLGAAYLSSATTLAVLAVATVFITLQRPHVHLLLGEGRPGTAARIGFFASIANIALVLILVPDDIRSLGIDLLGMKALGAAIALAISSALGYVLFLVATKRVSSYWPRVAFWKHVVAAALMVGVLWAIAAYTPFQPGRWFTLPPFVVLGAALYAAALVALRELGREDVRMVRETLNPAEMGRYLRKELLERED